MGRKDKQVILPQKNEELPIGTKLRLSRQRNNLSLTYMASLLHYSKAYLSAVENNRIIPSSELLESYNRIFQLQSEEFHVMVHGDLNSTNIIESVSSPHENKEVSEHKAWIFTEGDWMRIDDPIPQIGNKQLPDLLSTYGYSYHWGWGSRNFDTEFSLIVFKQNNSSYPTYCIAMGNSRNPEIIYASDLPNLLQVLPSLLSLIRSVSSDEIKVKNDIQ